jgi:hypothetical protein
MKQELKDVAVQLAVTTPTTGWALFTQLSLAEWLALGMAVLQALYLVRKWWREETEWGLTLKRLLRKTKPADLGES